VARASQESSKALAKLRSLLGVAGGGGPTDCGQCTGFCPGTQRRPFSVPCCHNAPRNLLLCNPALMALEPKAGTLQPCACSNRHRLACAYPTWGFLCLRQHRAARAGSSNSARLQAQEAATSPGCRCSAQRGAGEQARAAGHALRHSSGCTSSPRSQRLSLTSQTAGQTGGPWLSEDQKCLRVLAPKRSSA